MDAGQVALVILGVLGALVVMGVVLMIVASIPYDHN
jgi:hypothetical protein